MANSKTANTSILDEFSAKQRSINFSLDEVDRLQTLIQKYKHVLLCKKTDGTSSKQKENAWICIQKSFNANGDTPRTIKQLKYKFDNMKRTVKKEASSERQRMIKTGGGRLTPPPPPPPGEDNDWLRSIMLTSIDGNEAVYDDDVVTPTNCNEEVTFETIVKNGDENSNPIEITQITLGESEKNREKSPSCSYKTVFDTSTPHSSLKRPMASPLKRLAKKKKESDTCNIIKQALREKKMSVLEGLHNLELEKIRDSISQQKEMHELQIKNMKEKHQMEMIKLELEVEILKNKKTT